MCPYATDAEKATLTKNPYARYSPSQDYRWTNRQKVMPMNPPYKLQRWAQK